MSKDVFELSETELGSLNDREFVIAKDILQSGIDELRYQIENLDRICSEFSQRGGVLMTLAGLLTFLPSIVDFGLGYLQHYLLWSFPLLLGGIISFYFSQFRVVTTFRQFQTSALGTREEIILLRRKAIAVKHAWEAGLQNYDRVLPLFRLSTSLVYAYILSFSVTIMLFAFLGDPGNISGLVQLSSSFVFSMYLLLRYRSHSGTYRVGE